MNRSKIILGTLVILFVGLTSVILASAKSHQRLGAPGVRTRPLAGSKNLEILLPDKVPGYASEILTNSETLLLKLPPDTSFRVRGYKADDGFGVQVSVVLMGSDRSSIHKPQICMTGQGWTLDGAASGVENISLERPVPYGLPVNKLIFSKPYKDRQGNAELARGIYVYWFVDEDRFTPNEWVRQALWVPQDLLLHGILERWAYISYFATCGPGQEQATFDRMKKFIAESVPEYQLVPGAKMQTAAAH
jgi:hypothetical protein